MLAPPTKIQAKQYKHIWNGSKRGRPGFYKLWLRLSNKRCVKRGYATQEEFDRWASIPYPMKPQKMTVESKKYGFPRKDRDIRTAKRNWLYEKAGCAILVKIYQTMQEASPQKALHDIYAKFVLYLVRITTGNAFYSGSLATSGMGNLKALMVYHDKNCKPLQELKTQIGKNAQQPMTREEHKAFFAKPSTIFGPTPTEDQLKMAAFARLTSAMRTKNAEDFIAFSTYRGWRINPNARDEDGFLRPFSCIRCYDRKANNAFDVKVVCDCVYDHESTIDCQYTLVGQVLERIHDKVGTRNHPLITLTPKEFRQQIDGWCMTAGIRPMCYHKIRVTMASYGRCGDVPLEAIQKTLNHKDVSQTKRYCKTIEDADAGLVQRRNLQMAQGRYVSERQRNRQDMLDLKKEVAGNKRMLSTITEFFSESKRQKVCR